MAERQTTMSFSKTDWDDLAVMVQLYKIQMEPLFSSEHDFEDDSDSNEIIMRRIHLAERIMRASR